MRLVDSHCHIQAAPFAVDRPAVLEAALAVGVERILVPGWDLDSSRGAVDIASGAIDGLALRAAVGIHPHEAASADEVTWSEIVALATDRSVAAVGETGLDYDRAFAPRETQLANLRRHLALAGRLDKPAILHCRSLPGRRDAQDDLLAELRASARRPSASPRPRAILHSFSGPADYARAALDLGLMISFSGLVFRVGEDVSAEVARLAPADRLLVETDSPYLAPPGAPKRRNEPRFVEVTARWLAALRGDDPGVLGAQLVANHDRAFGRAA